MSPNEKIVEMLAETSDNRKLASRILAGPRDVALYVLMIGLERLRSVGRRKVRRGLKAEIKPEFRKGRVTGTAVFTERTKRRMVEQVQRVFTDWKIDASITLGNATREELLQSAANERASGRGHIQNAMFYEALAAPMQPGQHVQDHWTKEDAIRLRRGILHDTEHREAALS